MKIKSRKLEPNRTNQRNKYLRNNYGRYNSIPSGLSSMDFYQQNQGYSLYSKYKYINTSIKRPIRSNNKRKNNRSVSPVLGSEEYMTKKIEQTSAIIMRQLLSPNEQNLECIDQSRGENEEKSGTKSRKRNEDSESSTNSNYNKSKTKKSAVYSLDEIHEKIMNHITKLNDGKKKNLINSSMSGYDAVIEQIQKQKRLEISRALRTMCSQSKGGKDTNDFINSIIPDIGIKIEDIPHDLIEELRNTLDIDVEWSSENLFYNNLSSDEFSSGSNEIYTNKIVDKFNDTIKIEPIQESVKSEPTENNFPYMQNDQNSKQINSSIANKLETDNIDKLISNNSYRTNIDNNIITNDENNSENTTIIIKKEICEQTDSEYSDDIYKESQKNSAIVNIKIELCQDSEYNTHQTSSGVESTTEADNVELDAINLPISLAQMETCDIIEKNNSNEYNARNLILPIIKNDREKFIQNRIEQNHNTVQKNNYLSMLNTSTQTDEYETHCAKKMIDDLLTKCYSETPRNVSEAINRMFEIDECVLKLTNYRQSLFVNLASVDSFTGTKIKCLSTFATSVATESCSTNSNERSCNTESGLTSITVSPKRHKKRKKKSTDLMCNFEQPVLNNSSQGNCFERNCNIEHVADIGKPKVSNNTPKKCCNEKKKSANIVNSSFSKDSEIKKQNSLEFKESGEHPKYLELLDLHEKILVIKVVEDKFLVTGTESGKIIFYCLETGHYNKILHVCHVPITSLLFRKHAHNTIYMYVGSFDNILKVYSLHNYSVVESIPLDDKIQCMEFNWGYIFIGCIGGSLLRYKLQKKIVEFGDIYSDNSILVLKTAQEGARRVLLIGTRNFPVCIRDAMTGLYMRTMEDVVSPTVYSLILNKNLVYCGTTSHDILVYSFHNGKLIHRYEATDSKGIGCMKIDKNLLFASCHNGNIYVYDVKINKFISSIQGPGGVILSMEIFENQVIIGTMSFKFMSLPIPQHILQHKICN